MKRPSIAARLAQARIDLTPKAPDAMETMTMDTPTPAQTAIDKVADSTAAMKTAADAAAESQRNLAALIDIAKAAVDAQVAANRRAQQAEEILIAAIKRANEAAATAADALALMRRALTQAQPAPGSARAVSDALDSWLAGVHAQMAAGQEVTDDALAQAIVAGADYMRKAAADVAAYEAAQLAADKGAA